LLTVKYVRIEKIQSLHKTTNQINLIKHRIYVWSLQIYFPTLKIAHLILGMEYVPDLDSK